MFVSLASLPIMDGLKEHKVDILEPLPIPSESWESLSIAERMRLIADVQRYEEDLHRALIEHPSPEVVRELLKHAGHRVVPRPSNLMENSEDRDDTQTRPADEPSHDVLLNDEPKYPFVNFG